jgi:hypothetical protein
MLKGHSYKLKGLLEELFVLIVGASSREMMVEGLARNPQLLRMFIDYIVEREWRVLIFIIISVYSVDLPLANERSH